MNIIRQAIGLHTLSRRRDLLTMATYINRYTYGLLTASSAGYVECDLINLQLGYIYMRTEVIGMRSWRKSRYHIWSIGHEHN